MLFVSCKKDNEPGPDYTTAITSKKWLLKSWEIGSERKIISQPNDTTSSTYYWFYKDKTGKLLYEFSTNPILFNWEFSSNLKSLIITQGNYSTYYDLLYLDMNKMVLRTEVYKPEKGKQLAIFTYTH